MFPTVVNHFKSRDFLDESMISSSVACKVPKTKMFKNKMKNVISVVIFLQQYNTCLITIVLFLDKSWIEWSYNDDEIICNIKSSLRGAIFFLHKLNMLYALKTMFKLFCILIFGEHWETCNSSPRILFCNLRN